MTKHLQRFAATLPGSAQSVVDVLDGVGSGDEAVLQAINTFAILALHGREPDFAGRQNQWTLAITGAIPEKLAWDSDWYGLVRPTVDELIPGKDAEDEPVRKAVTVTLNGRPVRAVLHKSVAEEAST